MVCVMCFPGRYYFRMMLIMVMSKGGMSPARQESGESGWQGSGVWMGYFICVGD